MCLFQYLWCNERTHWYGTREIIKETSAVWIGEFRPSSIHVSYKIVVSWGVISNKCIHSFTHTHRPITSVRKLPSSWILIIWLAINDRQLCSSCNLSWLSVFLLFLFHIKDWGYNPTPCNLSHHCNSLCSRMMVYKWMGHMKVNQIHEYLFCHKSIPVLGEMHLDHCHSIFV